MPRYRNQLGSIVNVPAETITRLGSGWEPLEVSASGGDPAEPTDLPSEVDYSDLRVAELRAEIEARNEGRPEDERLALDGKKAELIDRLIGDDA